MASDSGSDRTDRAAAALADWRPQGRPTSSLQHIDPGHGPGELRTRRIRLALVATGAIIVNGVSDLFDPGKMIERFQERAAAVRRRALPPVEGAERQMILRQMQLDFQDFAMLGDAVGSLEDGILTLRIDLRPEETPGRD
jgi:hypothetical protein